MERTHFIEPEIVEFDCKVEQPASYLRRKFYINKKIKKAMVQMTALGVYEGYLNGKKLGNQELTPGYTDYNYRLQYQEYDVTEQIRQGENVLAALIGDGWYRGCINIGSIRNAYGTKLALGCCLSIEYEDGEKIYIVADETWKATQEGALRENNLKTIERVDARKELSGWNDAGYDDSEWHEVKKTEYSGELLPQQGELILAQEMFVPEVLYTPDGNCILDMGQNFAGHVEFSVTGRAGHMVSLTMGEVLDAAGNFTMKNLVAEGASLISGPVGQRLEYILKEGNQTFKSHFQMCGFRYVQLENWPEEVKAENFRGIAVYSDIPMTGDFTCSNELVNQLVKNVRWSEKSNFVDIPGDCPTRERTGWTADISVFSETACYLSNPRKFLKKWLQDYKLEQSEDGNLPFVVPEAGKPAIQRGCMGWSTAIANIAMTLYKFYGEKEDLADVYDCVKRFVEFNVKRAKEKNIFFLFHKNSPHRKFIIEKGFHYGEWLEPGTVMYKDYIRDLFYPDTEVTTAWFYYTVKQLSEMAEILEKKDDIQKYRSLAEEIKHAYHTEFLPKGKVVSKRHCRYVRPIALGLLYSEQVQDTAKVLNKKCIENAYRIGTGFLTTYQLLQVLSDNGYVDTAYKVLENTNQPGWLYAVTQGATTTWENWYGINDKGEPVDSHNHFAPGAVVAWLFSHCAGIRLIESGFAKLCIKPMPGGTFTHAKAEYNSCKGKIVSAWKIEKNEFWLHVEIPKEINTEVVLPDGTVHEVIGGSHDFKCNI